MDCAPLVNLLLLLLLVLFTHPTIASIPYSPSHVLLSPQHNVSLAYLLLSDHAVNRTRFLSLNLSAHVDPANPQYSLLLENAPFHSNNQSPFIPAIDDHGAIKVYTGDCKTADHAAIWLFKPNHDNPAGNGTWENLSVNKATDAVNENLHGPNYLAAGFAYASSSSDSSFYTFGGMCPFHNDSTKDWLSAARYSRLMTVLKPSGPSANKSYRATTTGHRAPPIAEAGFAMTPMHPTRATTPAGTTLQQQDFVLIGGHTHNAFINMSELAIFSVPQDSWSFVTVSSEPTSTKTELARDTPAVEPRSGHSAVLSPDGTRVIIFGGWVGDTSIPADPQLAILELGMEYGGTGPWKWNIPSSAGLGLRKGTGIYGHGAAMLPGGVMMIAGGYTTQSSKRSTSSNRNSQIYLYNVTSDNWVTSYANPDVQTLEAPKPHSSLSSGLSSGQKTGIGVGLGLGLPLAVGLVFLCWVLLRKRRTRQRRDEHLRSLAYGAERSHFWTQDDPNLDRMRRLQMSKTGVWGRDPDGAYPWTGNRGYGGRPVWRDTGEAAAEKTGLLVDLPSPTRNSRQSFSAKVCRFSGQHNEFRGSDTTGIHPIDEREEYEANATGGPPAPTQRPDLQSPELGDTMDPFADAPFLTPRSTNVGGLGIFHGSAGFASGFGVRPPDGRSSPEKDNRPSSNVSESTTHSASAKSAHQSRAAIFSRPPSWPSSGRQSPEKSASQSTHSKETGQNSFDSAMAPIEKYHSADSFDTANTTLEQRHAEGEHLLTEGNEPNTPNESPLKRPITTNWIGSIRRVFSVNKPAATGTESNFAPIASGIDRRSTVLGPSKRPHGTEKEAKPPRRAVSASAELFRRKQGARDSVTNKRISREMTFRTPISAADDPALPLDLNGEHNDDWDVESAAEQRRVQVTFTVPKERLRVVNAADGDLDDLSEKSISRSSTRAVSR